MRVDLGAGRTAVAVSAGAFHTCAILDTGQVRCWGKGDKGQLAQGNTANIGDDAGETTALVDLGRPQGGRGHGRHGHTCAMLDTGQVSCWGGNAGGQLGQGNTTPIGDSAGRDHRPGGLGGAATAVAAGDGHTCAVLDTGQLRCWGESDSASSCRATPNDVGDRRRRDHRCRSTPRATGLAAWAPA